MQKQVKSKVIRGVMAFLLAVITDHVFGGSVVRG